MAIKPTVNWSDCSMWNRLAANQLRIGRKIRAMNVPSAKWPNGRNRKLKAVSAHASQGARGNRTPIVVRTPQKNGPVVTGYRSSPYCHLLIDRQVDTLDTGKINRRSSLEEVDYDNNDDRPPRA
jgi:hypothetical protein